MQKKKQRVSQSQLLTIPPSERSENSHLIPDLARELSTQTHLNQQNRKPSDFWKAQPKQQTLLEICGLRRAYDGGPIERCISQRIGYGGAAFGGKTEGLIGIALIACKMIPGIRIGFFRRKFTELEGSDGPIDRTRALFTQEGIDASYAGDQHIWRFPNGSTLRFCHCQNEADRFSYQSQAFDILLIDEATHFTWRIIDYLLTRNRPSKENSIEGFIPFSVMCSNPGNIGHVWYMKIFDVDDQLGASGHVKDTINMNGETERSIFLPAKMRDNPLGMEKDPNYESNLNKREPILAKALAEGDWTQFSGQILRDWNRKTTVIEPFNIPIEWPRWRSIDWGVAEPFSCHFWARNPDTRRMYVYHEIWATGLTDPMQARRIKDETLPSETFTFNFADPSMWTKRTETLIPKSTYDVYLEHGIYLTQADNSSRSKISKALAVMKPLPFDGLPAVQIFNTNKMLIATLPTIVYDDTDMNRIMDGQVDHGWDDFCYGLTNWTMPDFEAMKLRKKKVHQKGPLEGIQIL